VSDIGWGTGSDWTSGIDVAEHHRIDFAEVRRQGTAVAIVRAGRGTRQDARWVEHARAADGAGLAVGSYWHVYPSHTSPHHQAELWALAVRGAPWPFAAGHWADIATADGFDPFELGRYAAAFLRRTDELLGHTVGVFTSDQFWRPNVRFGIEERPRWLSDPDETAVATAVAVRTRPADRGGPGWHLVRVGAECSATDRDNGLHLVPRGPHETVDAWRQRWLQSADVAELQARLNAVGADVAVDGVYGPATDAAMRTWGLLRRRDQLATAAGQPVRGHV
jgi:hypothetical protein